MCATSGSKCATCSMCSARTSKQSTGCCRTFAAKVAPATRTPRARTPTRTNWKRFSCSRYVASKCFEALYSILPLAYCRALLMVAMK